MKVKLDGLAAHLEKHVQEAVDSIDREKIADQLTEEIKVRTRLGYGVESQGASQKKLKPLSDNYVKQRKNMKLSGETSASKSNLTQTGEMLDDLSNTVQGDVITISFNDQYNKNKARWAQDRGRVFLNVSKTQISNLTKQVSEHISKYLKSKGL